MQLKHWARQESFSAHPLSQSPCPRYWPGRDVRRFTLKGNFSPLVHWGSFKPHLQNKAAWTCYSTEDSPPMFIKIIYIFMLTASLYMLYTTYSFLPDACRVRVLFSFISTTAYRSVTFESFYVSRKNSRCLSRKEPAVVGLHVIMWDRVIDQMVPSCLFLPWFKKIQKEYS